VFWRAIQSGNVIVAETAAREFEVLPLDYALALTYLYAEKGDPRDEAAALRYLTRYLAEANPSLRDVAGTAALLAERSPTTAGGPMLASRAGSPGCDRGTATAHLTL
jgi:hypothetical protein